ncbi:cytochrome P450 [Cantharellus anzutake]|uniref:cytochrome P450 n=1 Tax=Cantharellus anzutake TaxID=1750568 RepID=UPI001906C8EC|nr:cytochrome P450 [Cantharellus anzutake]KAF8342996.1 cytochrome P450 [Cantharellus anzutake]
MADNLKPSQRLTEDEVMAQISTFLFAGNDTTATGISWVMYALCKNSSIQDKLRAEIRAVPNEHPTYEALSSLPYLDAVIRETLRFQPPISGTSRIAAKDCIVPLSTPITRPDGSTLPQLRIAAGTHIFIPIQTTLNDPDVWGPDANEFKPERWLSPNGVPDGAMEIPSIKFLPFLAGPRACIGFRFSITEMKIVIFSLIRVMSFELAVDPDDIEPKARVVTRPRVKSRPEEGFQLPVLVRAL